MVRLISRKSAVLAFALVLGACTTTTVTPLQVQRPAKNFTALEIGTVQVADSVW